MILEGLPKQRTPWRAAVASFFAPGLGQLYAGHPIRGVIVHTGSLISVPFIPLLGVTYFGTIYILFLVLGLICLEGIIVGDAWRVAKASPSDYHLRWYNRWYIYAGVFLISSCTNRMVANVIRSDLVQAYRFSSGSMSPTLLEGDRILVNKFIYRTREPQRFDLVAFRYPRDPQKTFIMRIVGLPGETIEIRDKKILINGGVIEDPFVHFSDPRLLPQRDSRSPFPIPEGAYYVLGDNRDRSRDSRFWGAVPRDQVLGVVKQIYFSWDAEEKVVRWSRIGMVIR